MRESADIKALLGDFGLGDDSKHSFFVAVYSICISFLNFFITLAFTLISLFSCEIYPRKYQCFQTELTYACTPPASNNPLELQKKFCRCFMPRRLTSIHVNIFRIISWKRGTEPLSIRNYRNDESAKNANSKISSCHWWTHIRRALTSFFAVNTVSSIAFSRVPTRIN